MENDPNLTEHLILEILLRLPVKSLIRFRCVSKSWHSLISNPDFAKSQFDLAAARTHRLIYLSFTDSTFEVQTRSLDLEASLYDDFAVVNLVSPLPQPVYRYTVEIFGSCRGFILLGYCPNEIENIYNGRIPQNLLLWNPLTGVHKTLSYSAIGLELFRVEDNEFTPRYGFVYDASTDDYLVVIAWIQYNYDNLLYRINCFEFYSLRTNSWKQIDATHFPYTNPWFQRRFLFLNGAIHWLAISTYLDDESVKAIISFDLVEKNFSEIPLPHDNFIWGNFINLRVMGGCLCLCFGPQGFGEIWVMKEYKVKSSWTKYNYEIPTGYFYPICFTKGGQIVGSDGNIGSVNTGLAKLTDKGELLEHREYYVGHEMAMYTESLLSLPSDFEEA